MDVTLQRHCAKYIYIVPDGLRELMSDISREVLRSQPKDINTFIADYLDALMITRENARVAARFVQYLYETAKTTIEFLTKTGLTNEDAARASQIIQQAFISYTQTRGILKDEDFIVSKILEQANIPEEFTDESATIIQQAFRDFKVRHDKERQLLAGMIDWRIAARSAIKLYRNTGVSTREAKRAATMIKAAYKGYYTRRTLLKLKEMSQALDKTSQKAVSIASDDPTRKDEKVVRIDYGTVLPRVEFGDQVEIDGGDIDKYLKELYTSEEGTEGEHSRQQQPLVKMPSFTSTEKFVRGIITDQILLPIIEEVAEDRSVEQIPVQEKLPEPVEQQLETEPQPEPQPQQEADERQAEEAVPETTEMSDDQK